MAKYINKELKQFIIFSLLGCFTTALNILLLAFFTEVLNINYLISNILSYIIAVVVSYFANVVITFNEKITNKKDQLNNLFSFCLMKIILLHLNLYVCKIILTIVLTFFSFKISKKIVVKDN